MHSSNKNYTTQIGRSVILEISFEENRKFNLANLAKSLSKSFLAPADGGHTHKVITVITPCVYVCDTLIATPWHLNTNLTWTPLNGRHPNLGKPHTTHHYEKIKIVVPIPIYVHPDVVLMLMMCEYCTLRLH